MGRHFLQVPGPTNVPDEVLRAISMPTIDHRGPEFARLGVEVVEGLKPVFGTSGPVFIFPSSGTGAWEAALTNTLSPGDRVLFSEAGHFAALWRDMATRLGLQVDLVPGDWRRGTDPADISARLAEDTEHRIKAVCVVHGETSTGVANDIPAVRAAIDSAHHPALFMVDTISSLASIPYHHQEWGVDVTVAGSQKGLMLPPGLSFNAVSEKALRARETATLPRSYWDWGPILDGIDRASFPYTPATNLLLGLRVALRMLQEEGLENVFARHARHGAATRAAVRAWGLEVYCADDRRHSDSLTAVLLPEGYDADEVRRIILDRFDMSLGAGLSKLAGTVFRIGHLGHVNDLTLAGTLAGVQMGLHRAGVPVASQGVDAALDVLQKE